MYFASAQLANISIFAIGSIAINFKFRLSHKSQKRLRYKENTKYRSLS